MVIYKFVGINLNSKTNQTIYQIKLLKVRIIKKNCQNEWMAQGNFNLGDLSESKPGIHFSSYPTVLLCTCFFYKDSSNPIH